MDMSLRMPWSMRERGNIGKLANWHEKMKGRRRVRGKEEDKGSCVKGARLVWVELAAWGREKRRERMCVCVWVCEREEERDRERKERILETSC